MREILSAISAVRPDRRVDPPLTNGLHLRPRETSRVPVSGRRLFGRWTVGYAVTASRLLIEPAAAQGSHHD
jgi:hypothetical protein